MRPTRSIATHDVAHEGARFFAALPRFPATAAAFAGRRRRSRASAPASRHSPHALLASCGFPHVRKTIHNWRIFPPLLLQATEYDGALRARLAALFSTTRGCAPRSSRPALCCPASRIRRACAPGCLPSRASSVAHSTLWRRRAARGGRRGDDGCGRGLVGGRVGAASARALRLPLLVRASERWPRVRARRSLRRRGWNQSS